MAATIGCKEHGGPMFVLTGREARACHGAQSVFPNGMAALSLTFPEPLLDFSKARKQDSQRVHCSSEAKKHVGQRHQQRMPSVEQALASLSNMTPIRQTPLAPGELSDWDLNCRPSAKGSLPSWWKRLSQPLVCPLSHCPIAMLPYPPFKLRADSQKPNPYRLVDGRFLALQLVATGHMSACGRELDPADVQALDEYIRRCKLGPFRPGRALVLAKALASATSLKQQLQAAEEVSMYSERAKAELGKLRKIQGNRLKKVVEDGHMVCDQAQSITSVTRVPSSNSILSLVGSFAESTSCDDFTLEVLEVNPTN